MPPTETTLDCPTVQQVIDLLSTFPPERKIIIEDADTYWTIDKIHVRLTENEVVLYGEYSEMSGN